MDRVSSSLRAAVSITAVAAVLVLGLTAWADAKDFPAELYLFLISVVSAASGTALGVFATRDR
jgi:hypothetical protein